MPRRGHYEDKMKGGKKLSIKKILTLGKIIVLKVLFGGAVE